MPILAKGHEMQEPFPASKSTNMLMFSESFQMCVRVAPPKTGECIATNGRSKEETKNNHPFREDAVGIYQENSQRKVGRKLDVNLL